MVECGDLLDWGLCSPNDNCCISTSATLFSDMIVRLMPYRLSSFSQEFSVFPNAMVSAKQLIKFRFTSSINPAQMKTSGQVEFKDGALRYAEIREAVIEHVSFRAKRVTVG